MSKRAVGYIKYPASGETIKYDNADALIADYRNALDCMGVNGAVAKAYGNNLDLRYELLKIVYNEYGISLHKKQFIIEATQPEFALQDKLKVIYTAERHKKHRITKMGDDIHYTLKDGVLNNMSVKAVKNLVDRHYSAALKRQCKNQKHKKSEYERT